MDVSSRLSHVVATLPASGIRRFFDLAASAQDIISLGVGEPDFATPAEIRAASMEGLRQGRTGYTSNRGLPALLHQTAHYLENFGLGYHPERELLITVGGSEAIDLAMRALLCPGDEIVIPEPTYVSYRPCAILAGAKVVSLPTHPRDDFRITKDLLESVITSKTKAMVLCFPNNPTGAVMTRQHLEEIAEVCVRRDILVISDEVYAELTYDSKHVSIASLPGMRERTVVINGLSKAYAMTGWRIGYAAGPEVIIDAMLKIHQYTMLCAPVMAQEAALAAFREATASKDRMVDTYRERRDYVVSRLREIGLPCHLPGGAFYAFPDVRPTGLTSEIFTESLIRQGRVAVVPGAVFGESGEGFIRCAYATSKQNLQLALDRIADFVASNSTRT